MKLISTFIFLASLVSFPSSFACESDQVTLIEIRGNGEGLVEGPYTIEQLEKQFGAVDDEWEKLKALKRPNDEIFWVLYGERGDSDEGTNL